MLAAGRIGFAALLMTAVFVAEWSLGWVRVTGVLRTTVPGEPFGRAILLPALLFLGVGFLEELLARGYLLRNVAEALAFRPLGGARGGLVLACLISSALFALGHADNPNATWVSTVLDPCPMSASPMNSVAAFPSSATRMMAFEWGNLDR